MIYTLLLLLFFGINSILGQNQFAVELKQCYLKDKTKFDSCMTHFWRDVPKVFKTGIPELKIQTLDPFLIKTIDFKDQRATLQANAKFFNVSVIGASNVVPKSVKVDTKARVTATNVTIPYLNSTGDYVINGTLMLLPINGKGRFVLNMVGIEGVIKSYAKMQGTSTTTERVEIEFSVKNVFMKLDGLLGGDAVGEAINNLLSENGQLIFEDLKPTVKKELEKNIHLFLKDIFNGVPTEAFIS